MAYVSKKTSIHRILRDENYLDEIECAVKRMNRIVFHTTSLLNLFYRDIQEGAEVPDPDKSLIAMTMRVVSKPSGRGKAIVNPHLNQMTSFYDTRYRHLVEYEGVTSRENLSQVISYESQSFETAVKNNIISQYYKRLCEVINSYTNKKSMIESIDSCKFLTLQQKKVQRAEFFDILRRVKNDITAVVLVFTAPEQYHPLIVWMRQNFVPLRTTENLHFDLRDRPMIYFRHFLTLHKHLKGKFRLLPFRESGIPKNITIDTAVLKDLFSITVGDKENAKQVVWPQIFNMELDDFYKKDRPFHYRLVTDGISASLCFENPKSKRLIEPIELEPSNQKTSLYVKTTENISGKTIVAIDPNKEDLLYCVGGPVKDEFGTPKDFDHLKTFRFTKAQKNFETKSRKYRRAYHKSLDRKLNIFDDTSSTIQECLAPLNEVTAKTADPAVFQAYLERKVPISWQLDKFYSKKVHRIRRWYTYINTQRCEAKLVNNFKAKYGPPEDVIIGWGDYSQGPVRGCEPVKGKAYRDLFQRNGYDVRLVKEFRTSKMCHCCHGELKTFHKRESRKPRSLEKEILVHGLLRCQTCPVIRCRATAVSPVRHRVWNRDLNAAKNIYLITTAILGGGVRPRYLSRVGDNPGVFVDT